MTTTHKWRGCLAGRQTPRDPAVRQIPPRPDGGGESATRERGRPSPFRETHSPTEGSKTALEGAGRPPHRQKIDSRGLTSAFSRDEAAGVRADDGVAEIPPEPWSAAW
jgi:hypothetical protein